jgi:mannose-6-phosphate isomerase-like protein (cupin superfamily)
MEQILTIKKGDDVYALFFRGTIESDGARFLTKQTDEFQVGVLQRPKGHKVPAHQHPRVDRMTHGVSEFLYLEKGHLKVTVFDEEWKPLGTEQLKAGEFLLFLRGGHEIEMMEECRIIEVKQGPYPGDKAAKVFRKT